MITGDNNPDAPDDPDLDAASDARALRRRQARFEDLTLPHLDRLLAFVRRRVDEFALAEDLVQETYARAWQDFAKLRDENAVEPWLIRILLSSINDHYRKHARRRMLLPIADLESIYCEMLVSDEAGPLETLVFAMSSQQLRQIFDMLPPEFAIAVKLHDIEGYKYHEVAEIMGVPVGTVMSRLHRGRRLLRSTTIADMIRLLLA